MSIPTKAQLEAKKLAEDSLKNIETIAEVVVKEKKEEQEEEQKVTLSLSELDALLEKKLNERKAAETPTPKQVVNTQQTPQTSQSANLKDDLPEWKNWEVKDRIYVLCETSKSVSHGIRSKHKKHSPLQYFNPETNTTHSLRYATNQNSFFMDTQVGDALTEHILMKGGKLIVPKEQINLQKFLAIHPDKNKIWKEFDPKAETQAKLDEADKAYDAENQIRNLEYSHQEAIASVALTNFRITWGVAEVKKELFDWARANPTRAISLANDKSILTKGVVKTAIHRGIIEYKNKKFVDVSGKTILEVGYNEDEFDAFVAFSKEPEGQRILDYIKNAVS